MTDASGPNFLMFLGRLHPLLVHAPIGFLTLLAMIELAGRTRRFHLVGHARGVILLLCVGASYVTVFCGLLLAESGGYDPSLLAWHKWMGITFAALCTFTGIAYWRKKHLLYSGLLMVTLASMGLAGHFGASITHGKDYLTEYAPNWVRSLLGDKPREMAQAEEKITDPRQAVAYARLVQPIFEQNCISCHGADKQKGQFEIDAYDKLMKGGVTGPALVAGDSLQSLMVQRLLLPASDSHHMPPDGKPQPTVDQVALIRWWIDAGAKPDKTLGELNPPAEIADLAATALGVPLPAEVKPSALADLAPRIVQLHSTLGVVIASITPNQPWLSCNAHLTRSFGDGELAQLAPLGVNITELNLAGTHITDAGLATVAQMPNLQQLHLERTAITDAGLAQLTGLRKLDYINLYGTGVTDACIPTLKTISSLHHIYLWQTKVSPVAAGALADSMVDPLKIQLWQQQMDALQAKISGAAVEVDDGQNLAPAATEPSAAVATTEPVAVNSVCPITGKAVDLSEFADYKGRRIAFCCDKCLAAFKAHPEKYIGKVVAANDPPK